MNAILRDAHKNNYAVGSFSARYTKLIQPIIEAAIYMHSPVMVQLSEKEIIRHKVSLAEFSAEFYRIVEVLKPKIPLVLHLDHTKNIDIIREAIAVGFTSVMIDASEKNLEENIRISQEVVAMAHAKKVSVEAELGKIGSTDMVETDSNTVLFTDPQEALFFIEQTGIDALAVSVGTSHGLYTTTKPSIDYTIIERINRLSPIPLVLHGGSGVPSEMLLHAIGMPCGGISKVNIATELEQAMLKSLGRKNHMTEQELNDVDTSQLNHARLEVRKLVEDKIANYVCSKGKAENFPA
jgi:fructose-bisphosphate aldolase class II